MQTTVVNPCTCQQHKKPQQHDKIRGNQRNIINQMAQKQGIDLNKINKSKPCFICGRTNHLAKYCYFNPINQRYFLQIDITILMILREKIRVSWIIKGM